MLLSSTAMESGSISTTSLKALNILTPPTKRPKLISFFKTQIKTNYDDKISLVRCSTKPDTNTNIGDHQDSTFGVDCGDPETSNSINQIPSLSISQQPQQASYICSSNAGLVFDLGAQNSWDCSDIGSPVVKRFLSDDQERWYMWYHGRSSVVAEESIGVAVSSNGVHWERGSGQVQTASDVGSVMGPGTDWWAFDTRGVRPAQLVIMSSSKVRASSAVYWMYYTGSYSNASEAELDSKKTLKSLPGLAISQDGRYWARIEGEHHSGALFDWEDSLSVESPNVVFHGTGDLRMYYHTLDPRTGRFSIGVARSRDGLRWVKLGNAVFGGHSGNFDSFGTLSPYVVKSRSDTYLMAYEGVGPNGERSIGLAESRDGLRDWARVSGEAVLEAQDGNWDEMGLGSPCLVQMDGEENEWRLYYRGVGSEGKSGIGMATSCGTDFTRFVRWSGFRM